MILAWLAGCAPLLTGASPVPLPAGRTGEVGGAVFGGWTPEWERQDFRRRALDRTFGGVVYGRFELESGVGFGGRIDIGTTQLGSVGVWGRYGMVRAHRSSFGLQAELGLLYAELSAPTAFRIGGEVWVWAKPGVRAALVPGGLFPVGLSWELTDGFAIQVEANTFVPMSYGPQDLEQTIGFVGAVGLAARF